MLDKGLLKRDDGAKPQIYRPASSQQRTQKRMLGDLIDKVYEGSSAALMMHALSSKKATAEELKQIRDLLDQMEGES
ncbi:hypothetical protein GCM10023156_13080 [Novipirellula rosea]|uniref:Methicillin resistance regulatory protein MecI n=2 Tax=Novipirellula rosea TaxID=1031540 RepID=A0ABP8MFE5_9BACT